LLAVAGRGKLDSIFSTLLVRAHSENRGALTWSLRTGNRADFLGERLHPSDSTNTGLLLLLLLRIVVIPFNSHP